MTALRRIMTVLFVFAVLVTKSYVSAQNGLPGPDDEVMPVQIGDSFDFSAGENSVWMSIDLAESAYVSMTLTSEISPEEDLSGYLVDANGEAINAPVKNLLLTPGKYYLEENYGTGNYHITVERGAGPLGTGETSLSTAVVSAEEKFSQSLDLSEMELVAVRFHPAKPVRPLDLKLTITDSRGQELPGNARLFLAENSFVGAYNRFYFLVPKSDVYQVSITLEEQASVLSTPIDVIITRFGQMKAVDVAALEFTGSVTPAVPWSTPVEFKAGDLWRATVVPTTDGLLASLAIHGPPDSNPSQGPGFGFSDLPKGSDRIDYYVVQVAGTYTITVSIVSTDSISGDFKLSMQKIAEFEPINGVPPETATAEATADITEPAVTATVQAGETTEAATPAPAETTQAAAVTTTCTVTASSDVNLRGGPGTNFARVKSLAANSQVDADGQATGGDGFIWWRLTDGSWVRSNVVTGSGDCAALPQVTP